MYIDKENVKDVNIEEEVRQSYLDYAMSTIMGRALPDVRDGLKPVQRRIMYGMSELGLRYNRPYRKCAKVVGEVMGNFHPHGDQAIYDALVRMAQPFTYIAPLLDGQGNFGSIDGDPPAAQRYTEVRMARLSEYMLADLDKETVDFRPNYDESTKEPTVMPSIVPNLLLNGAAGIAVGMATEIPSHNLNELIDGVIFLIDNPDAGINDLIQYIPGPDFPLAGVIVGRKGIYDAYSTGKGKIILRGTIKKETNKKGKANLVITELPYKENKPRLIENIASLIKDGKLEGIRDLRDETNKEGIRIVLELKNVDDIESEIITNNLFKFTTMQTSYSMNFLALVHGIPKVMNLKQILGHFIEHRKVVVVRRTRYLLRKAEERAHILEGLRIALANIDEVIAIIKKSKDVETARSGLMKAFILSHIQAQAILDMRLQKLTSLEVEKLEEEYKELLKMITYYKSILSSEQLVLEIVKTELAELKSTFPTPRRTMIVDEMRDIDKLDLIQEEDMVITITHRGFIKRVPESIYRTQRRGGKGLSALTTIEEDFVEKLFIASTHDTLLMFTDRGRVFALSTLDVPEKSRTARGQALINLLPLEKGERICDYSTIKNFESDEYLVFTTLKGMVKKTHLSEFSRINKRGLIAVVVRADDALVSVVRLSPDKTIMIFTQQAYAIRIKEKDIKLQGRTTMGVKGIKLGKNDCVIAVENALDHENLLFISEFGYSKRTEVGDFKEQGRAGKGLIAMKITEKTGKLISAMIVNDSDDIFGITEHGQMVRVQVQEMKVQSRNTIGVRFIRLNEGDKLKDISRVYIDE